MKIDYIIQSYARISHSKQDQVYNKVVKLHQKNKAVLKEEMKTLWTDLLSFVKTFVMDKIYSIIIQRMDEKRGVRIPVQ